MKSKTSPTLQVCESIQVVLANSNCPCFGTGIRKILEELGEHDRWKTRKPLWDLTTEMKAAVTKYYQDEIWAKKIWSSEKLGFYKLTNPQFKQKAYLLIPNRLHRRSLVQFLASCHCLRVETGRWERPPVARPDRHCQTCLVMEDECHALLDCPKYQVGRDLFKSATEVTLFTLTDLIGILGNKNIKTWNFLARFIHDIMWSNTC